MNNEIIQPTRSGAIDKTSGTPSGFPDFAFEHDGTESNADPTLTLKDPWNLEVEGDFTLGGTFNGDLPSGIPIGSSMAWNESATPVGYLKNDGSAVSRTTYSDLFARIGTTYGAGDGSTTFNLPKSDYETGWIVNTTNNWTSVLLGDAVGSSLNHGMNLSLIDIDISIYVRNDTGSAIGTDIPYLLASSTYAGDNVNNMGLFFYEVDFDNIKIETGSGGIARVVPGGNVNPLDTEINAEYKIVVESKDFPANSIIRATNTSVTLEEVSSDTIADLITTNSATHNGSVDAKNGITVPVLHVQDQKTSGTNGGTFTSGAWRTRILNTVLTNTITGASLSSNQITLPAGTYQIDGSAPAYAVNAHKTRWRNTTDSTTDIYGTTESASASDLVSNRSFIRNILTITSTIVFELQHRCVSTYATDGFGNAPSTAFGETEIYSDVFIEKIA